MKKYQRPELKAFTVEPFRMLCDSDGDGEGVNPGGEMSPGQEEALGRRSIGRYGSLWGYSNND